MFHKRRHSESLLIFALLYALVLSLQPQVAVAQDQHLARAIELTRQAEKQIKELSAKQDLQVARKSLEKARDLVKRRKQGALEEMASGRSALWHILDSLRGGNQSLQNILEQALYAVDKARITFEVPWSARVLEFPYPIEVTRKAASDALRMTGCKIGKSDPVYISGGKCVFGSDIDITEYEKNMMSQFPEGWVAVRGYDIWFEPKEEGITTVYISKYALAINLRAAISYPCGSSTDYVTPEGAKDVQLAGQMIRELEVTPVRP